MFSNNYYLEFLKYLENEKNYSNNTIISYEKELKKLDNYYEEFRINILNIELKDLKLYIASLYEHNYSKKSISHTISVIKSFYNYLLYSEYIKNNPTTLLTYPKKDKKLPKFLYNSELKVILDSIDREAFLGKRNYFIIILLYSTGIRISELANLTIDDFDSNLIRVIGKGNKERIIPNNDMCIELAKDYINTERKILLMKSNNRESRELLLNNLGKPLTIRGIRYIINEITKKSKLFVSISPHTFRHTYATHLLENGMDLIVVQELLGHSNLSSTEVYTHLTKEKVKEVYDSVNQRKE